jgi:hypothetical protein
MPAVLLFQFKQAFKHRSMRSKIFLWTVTGSLLLSSCKKWLDVKPESQIEKEQLFSTESGFQEALNGIYTNCTSSSAYGVELTCAMPDVLAQSYTIPAQDYMRYLQTSLFNFMDPTFISIKDEAWKKSYNAIANCNLILANVETHKGILTNINYSLIKGEALALRAYLHFDVLRLFAPSFASNPSAKAIPYVKDFSNTVTPISTVTDVLNAIIADLNEARGILKTTDPILAKDYIVGYPADGKSTEENGASLFLQNRRHRLNYYAICGSLARAYLYMNKKPEALASALEVINSGKFPWTNIQDFISSNPQTIDRILYKELVFGWYDPAMQTNLVNLFNQGIISFYIEKNAGNTLYETGGVGGEDLRFKQWLKPVSDISGDRYELQKYVRDKDVNLHYLMAPALRLSELYYIASECTYDTDPLKATAYVDSVRFHRGINTPLTVSGKEEFIGELVKEARKEFYAEGQIFYMYKRLNRNISGLSGISYPASDKIFVFPLPNDEIDYGNR